MCQWEAFLISQVVETPRSGFQTLSLSPALVNVLTRVRYFEPTPIQAALIPEALQGRDVIGQAQTGTGKTAAFLLPFLDSWKPGETTHPQGIVLAPTRELVLQVAEEATKLTPSKHCRTVPIFGGQRFSVQLAALARGCALVVGTPGRVLDHLSRRTLSLAQVRYVVLDEADRMLDIGFRPDIEKILRRCPKERQTLLLSATVPDPVLRLAKRYQRDPVQINVSPSVVTVDRIRQSYISVAEERKFDLLLRVLDREQPRQAIIFCERKRSADTLYRHLRQKRKKVAVIHGDLPQLHRNLIMKQFRAADVTLLVATDVVGRGIDVSNISHIINYDLPHDPEMYVHRIGRTGRMGADGVAIAFVTPAQGEQLTAIESFINRLLEEEKIPGFEALPPRSPQVEAKKTFTPIFGQRIKRYSNRL